MMDAGAVARGLRLGGLGIGVVLDDGKVDRAVGEVARSVVANLFGLRFLESEDFLVELRGALEVVDFERDMHDAVHGLSIKWPVRRAAGA